MWQCVAQAKLTPKGDSFVVSVRAFFVNVFVHPAIPEWVNVSTFHPEHQNLQFTPLPNGDEEHPRHPPGLTT